MTDTKVYYLDEARDKYANVKKNLVDGKEDELIYNMVNCLVKGGMPEDSIFAYLENMSILCDPLSMTQDIRDKIEKSIQLSLKSSKYFNLAQEIREFVLSSNGIFLSSDVTKCLQVSSRRDRQHVSNTLGRLVDEGLIERYGKKNGCFRKIDKDIEIIDWKKNQGDELDISLPLSLNELVKIYPKNIIIIAGMSNAGKTALLLNIVGLNLDKHKDRMNYFSSEMGACELKTRLIKFGLACETWDGCKFIERATNFHDVIEPDYLNFIDYLEVNSDFWGVGEILANIANKLDNGIAIIALQKPPSRDEGTGGRFSLEKPRLYMALDEIGDYNELKIVKAKNWRNEYNPNKLIKRFSIEDGYKLIELSNWHKEYKENWK